MPGQEAWFILEGFKQEKDITQESAGPGCCTEQRKRKQGTSEKARPVVWAAGMEEGWQLRS